MAASDCRADQPFHKRASAPVVQPGSLRSLSAGLATSLLHSIVAKGTPPLPNMEKKRGRTDVPRARRPVRRPAAMNASVRSRRTSHRRQAIPDRLSFCRHETESLLKLSYRFLVSWCLGGCDVGGWAALCPLCLCGGSCGLQTQELVGRLSFCRKETEAPCLLSNRPFASLRLCVNGWACGSASSA